MEIEKIEMRYLREKDYEELKKAMIDSYRNMPGSYWSPEHVNSLIRKFPEGQAVLLVNNRIAGCALAIRINLEDFEGNHTYRAITGNYTFNTHRDDGDTLYGIDVFIKPEFRGLRLGRRLYDYRKELCERMNLKRIVFGGRIPNYHKHADEMSPGEYIEKVRRKEINDPVFNFQISNDFHPIKIIKGYLEGDEASKEYAVLLEWKNIYYENPNRKNLRQTKTTVRVGLAQWQMRPYKNLDELMNQVEFFVDAISGYRCDFALFPEFFNAPLMAENNHLSTSEAIRELAKHTEAISYKFSELAVSYNINIISGSMPQVRDGLLFNVGYLCKRDGTMEHYEKLHVTPDEAQVWGMQGGNVLRTYSTDSGKIGILICYDCEFPELSRILADEGMQILFVPFLTDTQNGYSRVRHCAQARAIENECFVVIAGSVGNLPNVQNMDIQFAQSMVFTPCDFSFPTNGIKAEATANTEMILVSEVDLDLLTELHQFGSVRNLKDRRKDIYEVVRKVI